MYAVLEIILTQFIVVSLQKEVDVRLLCSVFA
jgi:hypothetical protein